MQVGVKVDTRAFDRAMKEYMKYTSRGLQEAVNQHAYYTARNATSTTKAADKEDIRKDLEEMSKEYPSVPLAAILVNRDLGKAGKKGLFGEKMAAAVERFIKSRQAHRNFLRAGWIPAIKKLATVVKKKGGKAIPAGTAKKGRNYGGAKASRNASIFNSQYTTRIWNSAFGKGGDRSQKYIEDGVQTALDMEVANMMKYIERKHDEAVMKFWGLG